MAIHTVHQQIGDDQIREGPFVVEQYPQSGLAAGSRGHIANAEFPQQKTKWARASPSSSTINTRKSLQSPEAISSFQISVSNRERAAGGRPHTFVIKRENYKSATVSGELTDLANKLIKGKSAKHALGKGLRGSYHAGH